MKTIGLLGGMSWESTQHYYQLINGGVKARLGGLHSARLCLWSVDFAEIERYQHADDWAAAAAVLVDGAQRLERAGADFLVLATNTMHRVAPEIEAAVSMPLLHIADATGEAIRAAGYRRVGLLGTRFTMEQPFYADRLRERFALEVVTPGETDRAEVHRVIYEELCLGVVHDRSRSRYLSVLESLRRDGARAVVLGCTEIGMLLGDDDTAMPLFDTTALHAEAAVALALQ